jgi:DNA-directed RNA polymerase subunit alpha
VVEDATDIILNLKQIPLKLHVDYTKTVYLRVDKPGVVRAKDIEGDADVEILEPEAHIATVSEGGSLHMELRMKRGRGYVSADKNFDEDLGIGWIPVDSVHSPVKKVNYLVEAARLGQTTDYDKLTLDVWTNGSVTARDAVSLAAKLIRDHLNIFINLEELERRWKRPPSSRAPARSTRISTRASRSWSSRSVVQLPEERQHPHHPRARAEDRGGDAEDEELRRKSLNEIKEILHSMGLSLGCGSISRASGIEAADRQYAASDGRQFGLQPAALPARVQVMRHNVAHRKLGRVTEHRLALLRNQAIALLRHERIETTIPRPRSCGRSSSV